MISSQLLRFSTVAVLALSSGLMSEAAAQSNNSDIASPPPTEIVGSGPLSIGLTGQGEIVSLPRLILEAAVPLTGRTEEEVRDVLGEFLTSLMIKHGFFDFSSGGLVVRGGDEEESSGKLEEPTVDGTGGNSKPVVSRSSV